MVDLDVEFLKAKLMFLVKRLEHLVYQEAVSNGKKVVFEENGGGIQSDNISHKFKS